MSEKKKEDEKKDVTSATDPVETKVDTIQDPFKDELTRVQNIKNPETRTEKEKAEFTLRKNAERVKELGGDPTSILGANAKSETEFDEDDNKPFTIGDFKKFQQETVKKTALQLADSISNETERELVKYYLQNRIVPSGNPDEDFKFARLQANAVKNSQIMEESARKPAAKTYSSASGADAKYDPVETQELTNYEKQFLGKPWKMTKEQIIKARRPQKQKEMTD